MTELPIIDGIEKLESVVQQVGFLPFFRCDIPGYSLEERTPPERWFQKGVEGPWEWREQAALRQIIGYGKLVRNKAGFVSAELFPLLANYRRDGYDYDAKYEDGLLKRREKLVMDAVVQNGEMLSADIKKMCGFGKNGEKGFDGILTGLQMQTYLLVRQFVYKKDKAGRQYGWGVGQYTTAERVFGEEVVTSRYHQDPKESFAELTGILSKRLDVPQKALEKLLR